MIAIGLCGLAQSGKDTAASYLVDRHGFTRFAFADVMKDAAYALDPYVEIGGSFGWRLAELVDEVGWDIAKTNPDVRRLLQRFGTEMGRGLFGEDFWIDLMARRVAHAEVPVGVVFTDVRFPNEAAKVRDAYGGIVVEVLRPSIERLDGALGAHPSEERAFTVDHQVVNDGTAEDLGRRVAALVVP